MINWKIEKRNINDLIGYEKNPRKFTEKGLKDLKKSLERLGDANIITINADNTVLGGHARLSVMKQLGYTEVDVKVPDYKLNEDEIKEIVVRLNANTAGEWDYLKLDEFYDKIDLENWGLEIPEPKKPKEEKDISNQIEEGYQIIVDCDTEEEQEKMFEKFQHEGIKCRLLIL